MVYKRGGVYHYKFMWNGKWVRKSTRVGNKRDAEQIEAAERTRLAKGEVGIVERPPAPTLAEFEPKFTTAIETVCAEKPRTIGFYKEKLRRLLEDSDLAGARLDAIDEAIIDAYMARRSRKKSRLNRALSASSINGEVRTLRRMLRLAQEWRIIDRIPRIRLLRGERNREYVLSHPLEPVYLKAVPATLRDVAILILETGVRPGEAAELRWSDVHLQPAAHAELGYIAIRSGKTKNAKRNLSLTAAAAEMLKARKAAAKSAWVFPGESPDAAISVTTLDHEHHEARTTLKWPTDFVLHSLRHTMLTRLGESGADAFTIMRIAGHSSVVVSQRYVHPTPEGMERAFERLEKLNAAKREHAAAEAKAEGNVQKVVTNLGTGPEAVFKDSAQVDDNKKRTGGRAANGNRL